MAAQTPPYVIQASSHSAALFRQAMASLMGAPQPGVLGLAAANSEGYSGVVNAGDLLVTQNGSPNMSVNVAGGSVWIPQTIAANGGVYFGLNDATVNLAVAASNPTNPRIDTVIAQVNDAAYSGGTNNWALSVLTGTPTSGATLANLLGKAAQPSSSVVIAYILVPASASSIVTADIQDARPFVSLGNPERGNPAGQIYATATTGISSSVATIAMATGTPEFLNGGMTAGSNGLIMPIAGVYLITSNIVIFPFAGTSAQTQLAIAKNGGGVRTTSTFCPSTSDVVGIALSSIIKCAAGDLVTLQGTIISGSTTATVTSGQSNTFLGACLVAQ